MQILSLQLDHELDPLACAVEQQAKSVLGELENGGRNSLANKPSSQNNRLASTMDQRENDKENVEHFNAFVINKAKIEVQTVEAVQMNLDSVQLFTCDVDGNLGDDCFCITHDIHEPEKGD